MRKLIVRKIGKLCRFMLAPYIVRASWDGGRATHYSWTYQDALDWMRQYPPGDRVVLRHQPIWSWFPAGAIAARG